ncbi:hypothetical protein BDY19DRAFT_758309 [Irpex rosettiformis]|uniref:Uncharacterized protein n=1 Tax=Irpex rosettiformis TaxID=378272 RepID=A0ACB8U7F4_9APHY|nr:hypothetical protein BDY19DRAFT_758309 [Irpex rosettiformis]
MSRLNSTILDLEESTQDLEGFAEFNLDPQSPKLANAVFGSARQRAFDKVKAASSRRDSPTLPWRNPSLRSSTKKEPTQEPQSVPVRRPDSPDIGTILATTPRPRKSSTSTRSSSRFSQTQTSPQAISSKGGSHEDPLTSDFATLLEIDSDLENEDGGSESDSSLDIHTPLPHLMFRDGLLSPRSKLLPQSGVASPSPYLFEEETSLRSGTAGTTMSGLQRDPRDTVRRRVRHRDQRLLRAGMGLTTGLGWSDSEDEDAPSPLTRRLIGTAIDRKRSASLAGPSRPTSQYTETFPSRFASPVPPSQFVKTLSRSSLRSASVSFPSKSPSVGLRAPLDRTLSTSASSSSLGSSRMATPPLGLTRLPRNRADSTTSAASSFSSRPFVTSPTPEDTLPTPIAKARPQLPRSRAESTTSTSSISTALSSVTSHTNGSHGSLTKSISTPSLPRMPRPRAESTTSISTTTTASHSTTNSQYSQNSSSTASSSSTVPRPLRLPQAAALKSPPVRAMSPQTIQGAGLTSTGAKYQRQRTLSNPQTSVRLPILPATASHNLIRTTSNSLSSGVLPPGAPHTLRQARTQNGGLPRPRTGTGMAYRTSSVSYTSFHDSGVKMQGLPVPIFESRGAPI